MKVTTAILTSHDRNPDHTTTLLREPVVIVLETIAELQWAYATFARSIHHQDVLEAVEAGQEQAFNAQVCSALNGHCVPYRRGQS